MSAGPSILPLVDNRKAMTMIAWVAAVFPLWVYCDVILVAAQVSVVNGRWIRFGDRAPGADFHYLRIGFEFLIGVPAAALMVLVITATGRNKWPVFPWKRIAVAALVCGGIFAASFKLDPGGVWNWFFD